MSSEVAVEMQGSKWKRYPAYKNSGVGWLGEVPEHWEVKRIKQLVSKIGSGKTPKGGAEVYSESGITFLRSQNIHFNGLRLDDVVYITESIDDEMASTRVFSNDVLLNITGASLGRCNIVPDDFPPANVNQHVCIIRPTINCINPFFLNHTFASKVLQAQIFSWENGTSREGLTFSQIANLFIVTPQNIGEQRAIAAFIDRETGHIDTLIEKKERQIELLQEKRAALISHAVTKGLNPDVKMKDSWLEWIGKVPDHWEVKMIKRMCLVKRGASPRPIDDPVYFDDDGEYSWVRISDVTASVKYLQTTEQKLSVIGKSKSVPLEPGELFLSIAGSVGKPIITAIKCCIHDGFVYFVDLKQNREYMFFIFSGRELYKGLGKLGTQLNLNTDTVSDIKIPVPPLSEQRAIASFIDYETGHIDILTTKVRDSISKLREYRTALISAAVTGKIDVRGVS